tara:strand:+ start:496 stop:774 length:279 start_codon:yes stop_codon:yes gene_type:complete
MPFTASEWILVGNKDECPYTTEQIKIVQKNNYEIKGAILCDQIDDKNKEICHNIPNFPSFCNMKTNICVSGLRETPEDFQNLQNTSDNVPSR